MTLPVRGKSLSVIPVLAASLAAGLSPSTALPETPPKDPPRIIWHSGPMTLELGEDLAELALGRGFAAANADDARRLMERFGNPPSGRELGMVIPAIDNANWFVLFERFDVGFVKDDEKDRIDADALLASIREGTDEANEIRKASVMPVMRVLGWYERPRYDPVSHYLVCAVLGECGGARNVDYTVKILGREGYVSATFVGDPQALAAAKPMVEKLVSKFSYKAGKRYADYVEGDRIAEYGLTGLIANDAGGGTGHIAKAWKVVVAGLIGFGAGGWTLYILRRHRDGPFTPS